MAVFFFAVGAAATAQASDSIGYIEAFEELDGDTRYIGKAYQENYSLDIEKTGLLDVGPNIFNGIANMLFGMIKTLGGLVTAIFYFAMDFDISELFSSEINSIQAALKSNIFDAFFVLAFVGSAWAMMKKVSKRDMAGLITDTAKILIILLLSSFVVTQSAQVLSGTTSITKEISISALMDINDQSGSAGSYAANASGILWKSLVHDPWVSLEFGKTFPDEGEISAFLTTAPGSDARETIVSTYITLHKGEDAAVMSKSLGVSRIGFLIVYIIPFLIKSAIYLLMAILQLAFQVMAIFYVLLAPVILLLSLVPSFGGIDLVSTWLRKIFETQLMILIITFLTGVIIKLDTLLYGLSGTFGWLIVLVLETVIALIVAMNYKTILKGIGKINTVAKNPQAVRHQLRRSGDILTERQMRSYSNTVGTLGAGARNISAKAGAAARAAGNWLQNRPQYEPQDEEPQEETQGNRKPRRRSASSGSTTPAASAPNAAAEQQAAADTLQRPVASQTGTETKTPRRRIGFERNEGWDEPAQQVPRPTTTPIQPPREKPDGELAPGPRPATTGVPNKAPEKMPRPQADPAAAVKSPAAKLPPEREQILSSRPVAGFQTQGDTPAAAIPAAPNNAAAAAGQEHQPDVYRPAAAEVAKHTPPAEQKDQQPKAHPAQPAGAHPNPARVKAQAPNADPAAKGTAHGSGGTIPATDPARIQAKAHDTTPAGAKTQGHRPSVPPAPPTAPAPGTTPAAAAEPAVRAKMISDPEVPVSRPAAGPDGQGGNQPVSDPVSDAQRPETADKSISGGTVPVKDAAKTSPPGTGTQTRQAGRVVRQRTDTSRPTASHKSRPKNAADEASQRPVLPPRVPRDDVRKEPPAQNPERPATTEDKE